MKLSRFILLVLILGFMPTMVSAFENHDAYIADESYGYEAPSSDLEDLLEETVDQGVATEEESTLTEEQVCRMAFRILKDIDDNLTVEINYGLAERLSRDSRIKINEFIQQITSMVDSEGRIIDPSRTEELEEKLSQLKAYVDKIDMIVLREGNKLEDLPSCEGFYCEQEVSVRKSLVSNELADIRRIVEAVRSNRDLSRIEFGLTPFAYDKEMREILLLD